MVLKELIFKFNSKFKSILTWMGFLSARTARFTVHFTGLLAVYSWALFDFLLVKIGNFATILLTKIVLALNDEYWKILFRSLTYMQIN